MIWVIGNRGMLGTELSQMLESRKIEHIGTGHDIDITDVASLEAFAASKKIDWIVNCAAYTAVDKAEDDTEACRKLNTDGAANVAAIAKKIGARLIHISTDYVFNGNGKRPYLEDDPTDPIGVYGLTKRDGEVRVLAENDETYIIRTSWLYGKHGKNFVFTMLKLMNERDSMNVVNDQRGTPTWTYDLGNAIIAIIDSVSEKRIAVPYGIYHCSDKGNITWYDFACEIYQKGRELGLLENECTIKACTSDQFPSKVRRPQYSVLDKTKIEKALDISIPGWEISLLKFLENISEDNRP